MSFLTAVLRLSILASIAIAANADQKIYRLGDFTLESGEVLLDARLSYTTHGEINSEGSNVVLLPSFYLGDHHGYDFLIGQDRALKPSEYFIVAVDMFQNGLSSSPSNTPPPHNGVNFPLIAIRDNVRAQKLLLNGLGVGGLKAVIGFSMGAQQAFQWGVSFPNSVEQLVPICGSAVEHPHGVARLEGFKLAITTDQEYRNGKYETPPLAGLYSGAVHWAAWGTSQEWFRRQAWQELGVESLEGLYGFYYGLMTSWDANDLLALATTWQANNVGDTPGFNGDYERALSSISAKVLYIPCETDMYFHIDAMAHEAEFLKNGRFLPLKSDWGHLAGGGFAPQDAKFLNAAIHNFLTEPAD